MHLNIEHNLNPDELYNALVALTKAHGFEHELHECLVKAISDGPVIPRDPVIREIVAKWGEEFQQAIDWILHYIPKILTGQSRKTFFKAKPAEAWPSEPLTKEQIREIQQAIRDRFNYIASSLESDFTPDKDTLKRWKEMGIIGQDVKAADFVANAGGHLIKNAFVFGRMHMAIERGAKTYAEVVKIAMDAPLLKTDTFAVQVAEQQAAAYITKFGEDLAAEASALATAKSREIVHDMAVAFHKQELQAIKLNDFAADKYVSTWKEFSSELYHTMGDRARDWDRIAYSETYEAQRQGAGLAIMEKKGSQQLVYKMPMDTSCPQCRQLYLDDSGLPRLFTISEMLGYGNNIGRKPMPVKHGVVASETRPDGAETLKPVAGNVHPWCQCGGPYQVTNLEPWVAEAKRNQGLQ
jgi:hypothetical protein